MSPGRQAIGLQTLRRRGWTTDAVYALLGEPDRAAPSLKWDRRRVLAAEAVPGWAARVRAVPPPTPPPPLDLAEFGARLQGLWVERAVDNHLRRGRPGVPRWVAWPVVAPSIRERGQRQLDEDRTVPPGAAVSEAARLRREGVSRRRAVTYWAAGVLLLALLGVAFLGFTGHIWVGVLGHGFPYLAP